MAVARSNPLGPGLYRIDFAPELAPVFGRWRRANAERVHVLELDDGPKGARVVFAIYRPPGAFPFGQLGHPDVAQVVVGAQADWKDVIGFLINPLGAVEAAAGAAVGHFLSDFSKPELAGLRDALSAVRVNVTLIRGMLTAVADHTSPNPAATLGAAASLAKSSIEMLVSAGAAIPIAFPRHVINKLLEELHALDHAIKAAPGKALAAVSEFLVDSAKAIAPFAIPYELGMLGIAAMGLGGFLAWEQGKRSQVTDYLMLGGAAVAVLGGGALGLNVANLFEGKST